MLGRLHPTCREAHIIGAGAAGLLASYYLLRAGYRITLYDQSIDPGGLIATQHKPWGMVECAAHSLRTNQDLVDLCAALNVPLAYAKTKKKYIWRNGRLRSFPLTLRETLGMVWRLVTARASGNAETLADWGKRHLGQAAVDNLLTPLAHGIYGCAPDKLIAGDAFTRLAIPASKTLLQHALNGFGMPKSTHKMRMAAPLGGMGQLIQALHAHIAGHPNATLKLGNKITALPTAENILVATPAPVAARLLQPHDAPLAAMLDAIPYTPLVTATVCLRTGTFVPNQSIGVLHAADSILNSLGVLFNSDTFDNRVTSNEFASFTVMLGGTKRPDLLHASDEEVRGLIGADLRELLHLQEAPHDVVITHWPQAIPQYGPALHALLHGSHAWLQQPGHMLLGNYTGEVSLRGMIKDSVLLA